MADTRVVRPLAPGRAVSLLPRTGGPSWPATVREWDATGPTVSVALDTPEGTVGALDHHQVWLSTVGPDSTGAGVTIFIGRARSLAGGGLQVDGVVRMADEPRRTAVRAAYGTVTLIPPGGPERTVRCIDVSRGGTRLPIGPEGWTYDDPVDLVVHLDSGRAVNAVGRLLRVDLEQHVVVLQFETLTDVEGVELDRYALSRLRRSQARATRSA